MSTEDPLDLIGTTIAGKYVVERAIGSGGFSVVYRAEHKIWNQPVAIKCFTALSRAPEHLRRTLNESFIREGKLMAQLSTETAAIAQARDTGSMVLADGSWIPYLVLEWLQGQTLSAMLDSEFEAGRAARGLSASLDLLAGPIDALGCAHARGIAHLDVKPDNLLICSDGERVKILDFGLAQVIGPQSSLAEGEDKVDIISCTPIYAAPEQFNPKRGAAGPRTDVYALALVLVEIMRGGEPAMQGDVEGIVAQSQDPNARPSPRSLGVAVSDAVEAVFMRALSVDPIQRYETARHLRLALRTAMETSDAVHVGAAEASGPGLRRLAADASSARLGMPANPTLIHYCAPSEPECETPSAAASRIGDGTGPSWPTDIHTSMQATHASEAATHHPARPPTRFVRTGSIASGALALAVLMTSTGSLGDDRSAGVDTGTPDTATQAGTDQVAKIARTPEAAPEAAPTAVAAAGPCPDDMAFVTGGKFFMGSDSELAVLTAARPAHQVSVDGFCIDLAEVTVAQYKSCSDRGTCKRAFRDSFWPRGSQSREDWQAARTAHQDLCNENHPDRDDHPVNCVDWSQADAFCREHGKRLPSEPEWEFAARGSDGRVYPWGDAKPDELHMNGCGAECRDWREAAGLSPTGVLHDKNDGHPGTSPVGTFAAGFTQHGLRDMIGNVFEWTADPFVPYGQKPHQNTGTRRVIRGGAFNSFMAAFADPALRFGMDADAHTHGIGFRCASNPRTATPTVTPR
ncbi:MAG: bifunctional serine/threonine-protein kinase/formylglycine-generating enzyme family protein [Nannocystaceae bacterium]